jgi:transcriptional repressor NrdR
VLETRESESSIRRRRKCKACELRYTTYERPQFSRLVVRAPNGSQRNYTKRWLANAVRVAAAGFPDELLKPLAEHVEAQLRATGRRVFSTEDLGGITAQEGARLSTEAGVGNRSGGGTVLPAAEQVALALDASMPPRRSVPAQLALPLELQSP